MNSARTADDANTLVVPIDVAGLCIGHDDAQHATGGFAGATAVYQQQVTAAHGAYLGANVNRGYHDPPWDQLQAGHPSALGTARWAHPRRRARRRAGLPGRTQPLARHPRRDLRRQPGYPLMADRKRCAGSGPAAARRLIGHPAGATEPAAAARLRLSRPHARPPRGPAGAGRGRRADDRRRRRDAAQRGLQRRGRLRRLLPELPRGARLLGHHGRPCPAGLGARAARLLGDRLVRQSGPGPGAARRHPRAAGEGTRLDVHGRRGAVAQRLLGRRAGHRLEPADRLRPRPAGPAAAAGQGGDRQHQRGGASRLLHGPATSPGCRCSRRCWTPSSRASPRSSPSPPRAA